MSCAPSRLKISLALSTSLLSSVWTEMSTLPLRILPSYCLASYSGIPRPTSVPVRPPAAAPTAAPARAAIIGPAAMNPPSSGIGSTPIPTSHPTPPPSKPPAPAPIAAPSGAFVCCSWAKSRVPPLSGNSFCSTSAFILHAVPGPYTTTRNGSESDLRTMGMPMTPSLPTRLTSMDVPVSDSERMDTVAVSGKYAPLHLAAQLTQNLIGLQSDVLQIEGDPRVLLARKATQDAILQRIWLSRNVGQDLLLCPAHAQLAPFTGRMSKPTGTIVRPRCLCLSSTQHMTVVTRRGHDSTLGPAGARLWRERPKEPWPVGVGAPSGFRRLRCRYCCPI